MGKGGWPPAVGGWMHFKTAYENIGKYTRDDAKSSFVWRTCRATAWGRLVWFQQLKFLNASRFFLRFKGTKIPTSDHLG